jgi:Ca2+-binding RTX toxin-like protein
MANVVTSGSLSAYTLPTSSLLLSETYNTEHTVGALQFSGGNQYEFTGSFSFNPNGDVIGDVLNTVNITQDGSLITAITNIGINPSSTATLVETGNQAGFVAAFLAGDDSVVGNDASNSLDGFAGNDTVSGLGGNDTLTGGNGADNVAGGEGADMVYGGAGPVSPSDDGDMLFGGLGSDSVYGNGGDDTMYGGRASYDIEDTADILHGGAGADMVYGNAGNDLLFGGEGMDTLYGGAGNDTMYGGFREFDPTDTGDVFFGGEGNDLIYGNGGNDTLVGGAGSDTLHGGDGLDTYLFELFAGGTDQVMQFDNAGVIGGDTLAFTDSTNLVDMTAESLLSLVTYSEGNATLNFTALGSSLVVEIAGVVENAFTVDDFTFV